MSGRGVFDPSPHVAPFVNESIGANAFVAAHV
jgi:hypothetical protein